MRTSAPGSSQRIAWVPACAGTARFALGFTLLELLVVVAIMALATAGVSLALRDTAGAQLDREAMRLAALLESARAQSRARGVPVRWYPTETGFRFEGLPPETLPEHWLAEGIQVQPAPPVVLGPEPIIGPQAVVLSSAVLSGNSLRVATDGLRPFTVRAGE
jgi:general secretion pathway protein H